MNIKEIAQKIGAQIINPKGLNELQNITGIAPLHRAKSNEVSFLTNTKFRDQVLNCKAAAVIVQELIEGCSCIQLQHNNPQEAMALVSLSFFAYPHQEHGISPKAYIHESAKIGSHVSIYPFAYIDAEAEISDGSIIYPHVYVGVRARLGKQVVMFPGSVAMSEVVIGDRVIIHPNAVIGADGFGFASGSRGITKIPQVGNVVLEDDVEVGSLSNIDRATFDRTHIGKSTKIDSLVHIGHNVEIGDYSILCGQFGVAGSTKIGKKFLAAGQSAVTQGVTLGDGITLGGRCAVSGNLPDGGTYMGNPHRPASEWRREILALKKLPELLKRVRELEKLVSEKS